MKGILKMKKQVTSAIYTVLSLVLIFCLVSCGASLPKEGVWENATYLKDTELGKGAVTFTVEVVAEEQTVKFTVHTDKDTVGAALLELGLIAGEEGQYGLYIKQVNGITADYDIDQTYWAFYINGEYAMTGADMTPVTDGATYKFERTK